jgi:acyl transferase domain-containing protein
VPRPPLTVLGPGLSHPNGLQTKANGNNVGYEQTPKLLIWSTADEKGLDRIADSYESFTPLPETRKQFLDDLAFTLDSRRSRLPWNSFAIVDCLADLQSLKSRLASPVQRRSTELRIGYVFTGQGAQWSAMGRELICYASFSEELTRASEYLKTLGCTWSVTGKN